MAYQVLDIKTQKGMTEAESAEHLRRNTKEALKFAKRQGNYDFSREHLNFEVTKGGVISEVDKKHSIPKRMVLNLARRGIRDKNEGLKEPRYRTIVNLILGGSRDQMRHLAFGDQKLNENLGDDNSHLTRKEDIENWAKDMYNFLAKKYGEDNILAFVVHLDEKNPHAHCTLMPINEKGEFKFKEIFGGEQKLKLSSKFMQLHDELASWPSSLRSMTCNAALISLTPAHGTGQRRNTTVGWMNSVSNWSRSAVLSRVRLSSIRRRNVVLKRKSKRLTSA